MHYSDQSGTPVDPPQAQIMFLEVALLVIKVLAWEGGLVIFLMSQLLSRATNLLGMNDDAFKFGLLVKTFSKAS